MNSSSLSSLFSAQGRANDYRIHSPNVEKAIENTIKKTHGYAGQPLSTGKATTSPHIEVGTKPLQICPEQLSHKILLLQENELKKCSSVTVVDSVVGGAPSVDVT